MWKGGGDNESGRIVLLLLGFRTWNKAANAQPMLASAPSSCLFALFGSGKEVGATSSCAQGFLLTQCSGSAQGSVCSARD